MAMEIELRDHRHVQKLLTAVSLLLQQISTCLHDRMVSALLIQLRPVMMLNPETVYCTETVCTAF